MSFSSKASLSDPSTTAGRHGLAWMTSRVQELKHAAAQQVEVHPKP